MNTETGAAETSRSRQTSNASFRSLQTHIQVGSRQICTFQVGAAQVGVHKVASAQVGHLEVDVTEVEAGQIGAAEIKTLKTTEKNITAQAHKRYRRRKFYCTWQRSSDFVGVARRNRTNSLREMGEWSSGGCEFCSQHLAGQARHI